MRSGSSESVLVVTDNPRSQTHHPDLPWDNAHVFVRNFDAYAKDKFKA